MLSRRRFLVTCGVGGCVTAGCLETPTGPDVPRGTRILDDQTTVEAGAYRAWNLAERVRHASLTPVAESYVFRYEFTVEQGPAVTLAVTTTEELGTRDETGGQYQVWSGTRTRGRQGAIRERISADHLELLVVDNQHIGPDTATPGRDAATVHVEAYLDTPERN